MTRPSRQREKNFLSPPGSDYYYSLKKLPLTTANAIDNIFSVFDHITRIPITVSNDSIAHIKLQWWKKEIIETQQHNGTHPLSEMLYNTMNTHQLNFNSWLQIISTTENTLQSCQFTTEQSLRDYYTYTYGIREKMIAKILLPDVNAHSQAIYHFAYCLGLIDNLKNLHDFSKKMYGFFSDEELSSLSMKKAELFSLKTNPKIQELITLQTKKAKNTFEEGLLLLPKEAHKAIRCIIIRCHLALTWATLLQSEEYQILEKKIILTPFRKAIIHLIK